MKAQSAPNSVHGMFMAAVEQASCLPFLALSPCAARPYWPEGVEYTYEQAAVHVARVKAAYLAAGYGPGHRVALVLGNRPEYFWHFLALNALGACAVPVNPEHLPHEFAHAFTLADVSLVIVAPDVETTVREGAAAASAALAVVTTLPDGVPVLPPPRCKAPVDALGERERAALIIFTSGTTSRPKGCLISNASCLASGESYVAVGGLLTLEEDCERLYVPLPTFHMNATVLALNAILRQRGCLVTTDRFRASTWWQELRETRATGVHYLGLIPPILLKAERQPLEGAPTVRFGLGAGVDPTIHAEFEARFGFPLIEVWGMTETSRLIANAHEPREVHTRAFGRPHEPWEVMVADDEMRPVAVGEPGAFLVRCAGPDPRSGFFSGYVAQPDETEAAWRGGWFHTGDVVRRDETGMLYFVERRKNIIRRSGENIAAAEIEEAIIASPDVMSVAVLAVPDPLRDEEPLACIVVTEGRSPNAALAKSIVESARATLAKHKLPGWVRFVSEIPVTPTQKVRKDLLLAGFAPEDGVNAFDVRSLKSRQA